MTRKPAAGGEPRDLVDVTAFRLSVLSNRLTLWAARTYGREFGIGVLEWRVLAALALLGPATASEIVGLTVLDKSGVSRAVRRLVRRGFAERAGHPADGRMKILSLTPPGRALHARVALRSRERERRLFEGWNEAARERFRALVARADARAGELLAEIAGDGGAPPPARRDG